MSPVFAIQYLSRGGIAYGNCVCLYLRPLIQLQYGQPFWGAEVVLDTYVLSFVMAFVINRSPVVHSHIPTQRTCFAKIDGSRWNEQSVPAVLIFIDTCVDQAVSDLFGCWCVANFLSHVSTVVNSGNASVLYTFPFTALCVSRTLSTVICVIPIFVFKLCHARERNILKKSQLSCKRENPCLPCIPPYIYFSMCVYIRQAGSAGIFSLAATCLTLT